MPDDTNKFIYNSTAMVAQYGAQCELQPPEKVILERLGPTFKGGRVLDIGVGGGRTTAALAEISGDYIGVDYAPAMIEHCRQRFRGRWQHVSFQVADVRNMAAFPDASFDFVLFSFNGVDYVDESGRRLAFAEMRRVLRPDAWLAFSSHNIRWAERMFQFPMPRESLIVSLRLIKRWFLLRSHNLTVRPWGRDKIFIRDGAGKFALTTCYVRPSRQIAGLASSGYRDEQAYRLSDGAPLASSEVDVNGEPWMYFAARKK
jgi:SAM-dependent methyltransferase